ncbi:hypothetical protein [Prosthecobacter sp.]|uniref:hypothetical protein n=1 Tax=Prosthecobacter sp. TaxID=1965333 RepID=UPI003782FA0D
MPERFWHCLHSTHDRSAGESGLFRQGNEHKFRAESGLQQRLEDEAELLGFTVSGHPLDSFPQMDWRTYRPISELHHYHNQRVTICGLIIMSRSHIQQNGQPMKIIFICNRTGIVECEIFAAAYRAYGLNTVRHPVVQVTGDVKPCDNGQGFTLGVRRVVEPRIFPVGRK